MHHKQTKIIILAGGDSNRFGGPKHLSVIRDEPIIKRTLRLIIELGVNDITVITPPGLLADYAVIEHEQIKYVERSSPPLQKLLQAAPFLLGAGQYIILLGDVFFTRRALKTILEGETKKLIFYCRYKASSVSERNWGEIFALTVPRQLRKELLQAAKIVSTLFNQGVISDDSIWDVAKIYEGIPASLLHTHPKLDSYFEINDHTNDVDYPEDVDRIERSLPLDYEGALDTISKLLDESSRMKS